MIVQGKVLISRAMGGKEDSMHITVEDSNSRCRILECWMTLEEFAKGLTSSYGDARIEFYEKSPIGKYLESKTELVPFKWTIHGDKSDEDKALAEFEVDGWKGNRSDLTNHHRSKNGKQQVTFYRYVKTKSGTP